MSYPFIHSKQLIMEPVPGSPWADEMVLNPAIIQDPQNNRIHMLFRATGPYPDKQLPERPLPYPIFLGYAFSEDGGKSWTKDMSRPALAPNLSNDIEGIYIKDIHGKKTVNYANGCVEDPRLFFLDGKCFVIVACRMFPPGPYWIHDEPTQCSPDWIHTHANPFGKAASENLTSNVLYQVNLNLLSQGDYDHAFQYVTHLTDAQFGDNRDVMLFPEKLFINGKAQYVCLHRPKTPHLYLGISGTQLPSMMICASESIETLWKETNSQTLLASPSFDWEGDRVGASAPPIRISDNEWLLSYHGKKDDVTGYTQSFMILKEQDQGLPIVTHRCSERLIVADQPWEMPSKFSIPCVFITGLIKLSDTLMISYGAADEKVGIAKIDYQPLLDYLRKFDAQGNK